MVCLVRTTHGATADVLIDMMRWGRFQGLLSLYASGLLSNSADSPSQNCPHRYSDHRSILEELFHKIFGHLVGDLARYMMYMQNTFKTDG